MPKVSKKRVSSLAEPQTSEQLRKLEERAFQPVAIEIGWLTYEWNRLHAAFAELFADIVSEKRNQRVSLAAWHSIPSDRTQRDMLRAALATSYKIKLLKAPVYEGAIFVLNELNSLSGKRNTALHSPFAFAHRIQAPYGVEIIPFHFLGNPHATNLTGKELLAEFKWYRACLFTLANFAQCLHFAAAYPEYTLPDKPQLPQRGQFQSRAPIHRKKRTK
jgi:hypothetical protein